MPDLRQALKDFVATSNSGKYRDEATLLSKFPELQGYDIQLLRDFVTTSNSGKYKTEEEIFAKFPEFNLGGPEPAKKKVATELPSEDGSLDLLKTKPQRAVAESTGVKPLMPMPVVKKQAPITEEDYFEGAFGDVLRGFDKVVPLGIGDFVDDIARSVAQGRRQGIAAKEADRLLMKGTKATPEQIQKFIETQKQLGQLGESAEMQEYNKIYNEEGGGVWGFIKAISQNPTYLPQIALSSLSAMANNADALTALAAGVGTGAGVGATTGAAGGTAVLPVIGTVGGAAAGAASGAAAALPYAFGLASSVVEFGSKFGELINEELDGKPMTKENVRAILEDPDKLQSMRNKALVRGAIIGTIDAYTGKLASSVGAKILTKSAAKSATGAATKAAITKATAAGAGVEALGGSAGEAAAKAALGEEMDASDILLEGFADLPGGIRSTIQAKLAKPSYSVNGEKVDAAQVDELINTMTPEQLAQVKIDIKNDYEGRTYKIQDKIVTGQIKKEVQQANPNVDEATIDELVGLEKELKKFEENKTQSGKDRAAAIRSQIKTIQENAVQKQAAGEVPVQPTPGVSEEVEGGKPQPKPEVITTEGVKETITPEEQTRKEELTKALEAPNEEEGTVTIGEEIIPIEDAQKQLSLLEEKVTQPAVTRVKIAPFFNTQIASTAEAAQLRQSPEYKSYLDSLNDIGAKLGVKVTPIESIGGYENEKGEKIVEISNDVDLENATMEQAENFAALASALAPQVQEAAIAAQYINQEGGKDHKANEYTVVVSDVDGAIDALKAAGISDFSINENTGEVSFIDLVDFTDPQLQENIGNFLIELESKGINYEQQDYKPLNSTRVGKAKRKAILGRIKSAGPQLVEGGQDILPTIKEAVRRDAEFQGVNREEYFQPRAGNRLFNKPLERVSEIANRYYERVFGKQRPKYYGSEKIDEARAKRIADAFDKMKHDPNNPEVKAAYEAMAKETLDQYKNFLDAGYKVEINNNEPYANSQEMIDDLRNNKRMKIFSTESGFGDNPITEQQRKENPLLRDSGYKDANGQPMLINDVFRAIHDFYGHAELGNSFGPKGEENAWNVHARMFSPLARAAMTTETRGQNSYVNFSGINDNIKELRKQARDLREEGLNAQARKIEEKIYELFKFADQKTGLLPEEFYQIDETDLGDADRIPEAEVTSIEELLTVDTKEETTLKKILDFLDKAESDLDKFGKETAGINIAIPVMKAIIKTVKALVKTGITLQEAINRAASENKVSEQDVIDSINLIKKQSSESRKAAKVVSGLKTEQKKATVNEMNALKNQIRLEARAAKDGAKSVSESVKAITKYFNEIKDRSNLTRKDISDVLNIISKVKDQKTLDDAANKIFNIVEGATSDVIEVNEYKALKDQIKLEAKAAREGAKSVSDAVKAITKYFNQIKDRGNLTRNDISKVLNIISGVKNQETLDKAADKIFDIVDKAKTDVIEVSEYKALKDQIKLEARAAREAKQDLNAKRRQLADFVRKMAASGKIPANRVAALVNRIGKVNLDSNESVERFVDYAGKLFADADYANKLNIANETKRQINKLSKNKEKFANLRDLGSKFVKIDPSMVDNIDEYNQVASLIKDSIKGSTTRGADTKFTNMIKESDAIDYINNTMKDQEKKLFDMKVDEVRELFGVDASNLTYNQLMEMVESKEPLTKDNEKLIRAAINKAFGIYSAIIDESIRTGKDLFTGQDVEYTANQKRVVREFMNMNLNLLKPKQALEAVDALMNFLQNKSIAKMESVVAKYKGDFNMEQLKKKGIRGRDIRKYWSKGLGRLLVEQTANIDFLFEREFGGFYKGGEVMDAMGLTDAINGKADAQKQSDKVVEEYVDKFYKQKPNGEAFNTSKNNTERGMVAFMSRSVIGNEAEMQAEFNRRKNLILKVDEDGRRTGSIAELEDGNEQEVKKAKLYQEVYDKILKDSNTIEEVQSKAAKENVDAVKFWQDKWADKYDDLYDVALGVYNKVLGKDINFNPDRYSKLSSDPGKTELATEDMGFIVNSGNAPLYKKETGVLMAATRPEVLPVNEDTGRTNRYIDLSFDSNNSNSYYDALVDINTAAPIRQMQSALNSEAFEKMVKNPDDRKLIRNRINLFVNNARKKNPYSNDEFSTAVKKLNRLTNIAVGQALGGVTQPIKQTIPIAMNTLINAGDLDVASVFNQAEQDFINNSGYAIANRGAESQAQIESLNKLIEEEAKNKGEKLLRGIEKLNKIWLKNTLVKFDLVIARASWMTYYKQALKKQGIDPSTIDFSTHEVNKEAADYAQRQVNRQQNVSDADLAGELLSSKDAKMQLFVKILMPFSSFRMNQSARLGSDLATLMNKTATVDDKKIALRSLAGTAVETATFRALQAGVLMLTAKFVKDFMGREDDEEKDKKKKDAILKGQLTSIVADVFSPTPIADKLVQLGVSSMLEETQDALDVAKENRVSIYSGNKQDVFQTLGLLGITGARAYQLYEMAKLSSGAPYKDDYGREKYLSEEDRESIQKLIPFAIMASTGLAPAEVNSFIRSSLTDAKRSASTVEGGKSKEDVEVEQRGEELTARRKERSELNKSDKVEALREMKEKETNPKKRSMINQMIIDLSMTPEEEQELSKEIKEERLAEREQLEALLQGYDNKTDMKRYDPALYEKTFGEGSEYYKKNKPEMEIERELNKLLKKKEDKEMGYVPPQKKKKSKYSPSFRSFEFKYKRQ